MAKIAKYEVIIVGAGASGLSAAREFEQQGISSLVLLEASDRIGGRIRTVKDPGEGFLDLGAQWIHGYLENDLFEFACPLGLIAQHSSVDGEGRFMSENGEEIDQTVVDEVMAVIDDIRRDCCSLGTKRIDRFPPSAGRYFKARFEEYLHQQSSSGDHHLANIKMALYHWATRWERVDNASDSLDQLNAKLWGDFEICRGDYNLNPKFGMTTLMDSFKADLKSEIIFHSPVVRIDLGQNLIHDGRKHVRRDGRDRPVLITCSDGSKYECQHVVVTSSLGYLKEHARDLFAPLLPSRTLRAIDNIGFGVIGKIFLVYDSPWWKEDFVGVHLVWTDTAADFERTRPATRLLNGTQLKMDDFWYRSITGFDPVFGHKSALCGWLAGPEAAYMESLSEETVAECCSTILRQFLHDPSIPSPTKVYKTDWQTNPYILGSYSNRSCSTRSEDIAALNEPLVSSSQIPLAVLAGEANSERFFSTVHGAIASGRHQARHYIDFKIRTCATKNKL